MHLFLQGARGVGKSSLLREALTPCPDGLSGFVVQRLTENGAQTGFRAAILSGGFPPLTAEYSPAMSGIFLLHGEKTVSVLDEVIARVEEASHDPRCKLLLLDEIGGIELASPAFMGALRRIVSGSIPCIGVFKSAENMAHTASVLRLGRAYRSLHQEMEKSLRERGELITLREDNRADVKDIVLHYLKNR